ncbi:MAG: adenosylcobalamin-dependent ribonucleoside-diphosphate reductase, partial [Methanocalculus sp. MSAO_Arc1]
MNAGTASSQLAACFVLPVGSTVPEIFESMKQGAVIQVSGGGTGYNFSAIPPAGAAFGTGGGVSPGPVPFIGILDAATGVISQEGRRRGANMGILDSTHPDILSFIAAKHAEGVLSHFNLSVMIPDRVMEAIENGETDRVLSTTKTGSPVRAGEVFEAIVEGIYRNGEPGILFEDAINRDNNTPALGRIRATNPCGEEPLLPYESCILGSINLAAFVDGGKTDHTGLAACTHQAVRFLDAAIDATRHPLPEIAAATLRTRKIGLGIMGLHDALLRLGLPYDSDDAREYAGDIMAFITDCAVIESKRLAEEFGPFPAWEESRWEKPIRNASLTTIAPTGTISLLAGCSPGIEPVYSFVLDRHHTAGRTFELIHPIFSDAVNREIDRAGFQGAEVLRRRGEVIDLVKKTGSLQGIPWLSSSFRNLFVSASDIAWMDHLLMQAACQRSVHASIAKTINLRESAGRDDIRKALRMAYRLSLKGVTLYRMGSRIDSVYQHNGCRGCRTPDP